MRKLIIYLPCYFMVFFAFSQNNPSISIHSNNNGLIQYNIQNTRNSTHIFTLFGDGTYGFSKQPLHKFKQSNTGYTTETYFVKAYDTNVPPKNAINTGKITGKHSHKNSSTKMSGNIDLFTSWATAKDFENFYIIAFKNSNSRLPINGCVEFLYDTNELSVNTDGIKVYNNWVSNRTTSNINENNYNKKLKWEFSNLKYNETRYIYVPASTDRKVGKKIKVLTKYFVNCTGIGSSKTSRFMVRKYPHDPNFKIINKECLKQNYYEPQQLEYTIGFFNDGTNFAHNINIADDLSPLLNPITTTITNYEHQPNIIISDNQLTFDFVNINLPGTQQINSNNQVYSYEDCFSYVSFMICTLPFINNCIDNIAEITFDNQNSFYTTLATICPNEQCAEYEICFLNRNQIQKASNSDKNDFKILEVYPNPTKNTIHVSIDLETLNNSIFKIKLMDYSGNLIKELFLNNNNIKQFNKTFKLNYLPNGLYILVLETSEGNYIKKINKID